MNDDTAFNEVLSAIEDDESNPLYCWILGELNDKKKIKSVCYSVFSLELRPPPAGWSYVGLFLNDDAESVEREEFTGGETDKITLEYGSHDGKLLSRLFALNITFTVEGSCYQYANGRYMEDGHSCGAPVFHNVRKWTIFRHCLREIPALGISAGNSYQFSTTMSLQADLDKSAGKLSTFIS